MRELDGNFTFANTDWSKYGYYSGGDVSGTRYQVESDPLTDPVFDGSMRFGAVPESPSKANLRALATEAHRAWLAAGNKVNGPEGQPPVLLDKQWW